MLTVKVGFSRNGLIRRSANDGKPGLGRAQWPQAPGSYTGSKIKRTNIMSDQAQRFTTGDAYRSSSLRLIFQNKLSKSVGLGLVFALTALLCLPFIRALFWLSDEGVLLRAAERMIRGDRLNA